MLRYSRDFVRPEAGKKTTAVAPSFVVCGHSLSRNVASKQLETVYLLLLAVTRNHIGR